LEIGSSSLNVVIACGGTGGHLFPGIAVAEALEARGHRTLLLISEKAIDREASKKYAHLSFETVPAVAKPASLSPRMIPFLLKIWTTTRRCRRLLLDSRADAVLGMGGFTSLPPVLAGHRLGLKTFVHDSNARPGRSNVLTSRFCTRVLLGMGAAAKYFPNKETVTVGTPVRRELTTLPERASAAAALGLDPRRPVVAVIGGSQGAKHLNTLMVEAAAAVAPEVQFFHAAGPTDYERVAALAGGRAGYRVVPFCDRMAEVYAVADLMVCRAGASSLTEMARSGMASLLVPYPYAADDHQTKNAEVFAEAGAARVWQERGLSAAALAAELGAILGSPQRLEAMRRAARALAVDDAAERVCGVIETTCAAN
jgi:UDP-N-acetylglucosamine--N-acetylmuramyl-(pentapeptide) pyrophosphoryl-undecaprenol N-acetylglucosamine transferase